MAKDPRMWNVCRVKPDAIRHSAEGKEYFSYSTQHLNEFTAPEVELRKLKIITIVSIALTIPIAISTYAMLLPKEVNNYVLLAPAVTVQFWAG